MRVIYIFLFVMVSNNTLGQVAKPDCKSFLKEYVNSMRKISKIESNQVYKMKYNMSYEFRDNNTPNQSVDATLIMSLSKSFYYSNVLNLFADKNNGFMVMPLQRQIIWGPGNKGSTELDKMNTLLSFQDTLIEVSSVESCKLNVIQGDSILQISLLIPKSIQEPTGIDKLVLKYSYKRKMMESVVCQYVSNKELKRVTVTYYELDFDYEGNFNETAYQKVFKSKGKLREEYRGFEVIDNRDIN